MSLFPEPARKKEIELQYQSSSNYKKEVAVCHFHILLSSLSHQSLNSGISSDFPVFLLHWSSLLMVSAKVSPTSFSKSCSKMLQNMIQEVLEPWPPHPQLFRYYHNCCYSILELILTGKHSKIREAEMCNILFIRILNKVIGNNCPKMYY